MLYNPHRAVRTRRVFLVVGWALPTIRSAWWAVPTLQRRPPALSRNSNGRQPSAAIPRRRGALQEGADAGGQARRAQRDVGDSAQAQGERESSGRSQDQDLGTDGPDRARQTRAEE